MNSEHPPLAKMWSALPLLFFLPHDSGPLKAPGNFSQRGAGFYGHFWEVNRDDFLRIWFWARTAMVAFTVGLGVLLFTATRWWFGTTAAILAVLLYSFEPNVLGHGRLVHTDIAASFMYLLFFVVLVAYARSPSSVLALLLGFVTGLALLTKFSMIVLIPVLVVFFLFQLWRTRRDGGRMQRFGHPLIASLVILLAIHAAYGFRNPPLGPDAEWIQSVARHPLLVLRTIEALSHVFPRDFLLGVYIVEMHNSGGHSASILGQYDYRGWWYYFPVAFALKTPVPFLLLSVAGIARALWKLGQREYALLLPLIPLAIYSALAMSSSINIGIRHFLPAFPFLFMLGGVALASLCKRAKKLGLTISACLLGLMAIEAIRTFPHYISFVNQLKGGNPGWRYLSDSNVEWGDAVPELVEYLQERGVHRISGALLGGNMTLHFYGIEFAEMYGPPPSSETPYLALGGSFLNGSTVAYGDATNGRGTEQQRVNFFDAYRKREPVAVFGDSIYLFENPGRAP